MRGAVTMSGAGEFVDLPLSVRQIAVSRRFADGNSEDVPGTREHFSGLLRPFDGILNVGVITGKRPPPALSHLVLGDLVTRVLADVASEDQPPRGSAVERDDAMVPSGPGDENPELRVRDLIRRDSDRTSADESDPESDPSTTDTEGAPTIQTVIETEARSEGTQPPSSRPTVTTNRTSTAVVQRYEGPELTVVRDAALPDTGGAQPSISMTRGAPDVSDRPSLEPGTATQAPETGPGIDTNTGLEAGTRVGQGLQDTLDARPVSTMVVSPHEDGRSRDDLASRTEPDGPQPTPETVDSPEMAVRHDPSAADPAETTSGRGDATTTAPGVGDRPVSRSSGRSEAEDGPASQSIGRAEQSDPPQRIDDLVDVERLADRLSDVFERKARIERERRGR